MPLYAGTISKEKADDLVKALKDHKQFWLNHPIPSVPLNSKFFSAERYWQGPTWVNTNWLLIDGLKRYGYDTEAQELSERTIAMVSTAGVFEYFSPIDGKGLGDENFSWTAALTIDLLQQ
jgi:glycogen debranching enzyme